MTADVRNPDFYAAGPPNQASLAWLPATDALPLNSSVKVNGTAETDLRNSVSSLLLCTLPPHLESSQTTLGVAAVRSRRIGCAALRSALAAHLVSTAFQTSAVSRYFSISLSRTAATARLPSSAPWRMPLRSSCSEHTEDAFVPLICFCFFHL